MECEKKDQHKEYIDYNEFEQKSKKYMDKLDECLHPHSFTQDDLTELYSFLKNMSRLTGLLLVLSNNKLKWSGTGFIVKLRRQRDSDCPCPSHKDGTSRNREHAILTISTAYHMFNERDKNDSKDGIKDAASIKKVKRFDEVNEIWGKCETLFKLGYNTSDQPREELPTLYGHRLVEMDKDLDIDCDWCAIECVTHETELIDYLEKTISDYQIGLAELYTKSQTSMYKDVNLVVIIGHPHNWAKRISIGQSRKFRTAPEKEILKEVRSRQTWCMYSYNNPTCGGSSGSPIFKWGQTVTGFGYWFGHPHNHSKGLEETDIDDDAMEQEESNRKINKVYFGNSTIGVENIY